MKRTPKRLRGIAKKESFIPGIGNLWSTQRNDWRISVSSGISFTRAREIAINYGVTVFRGRTVFNPGGSVSHHVGLAGPRKELP